MLSSRQRQFFIDNGGQLKANNLGVAGHVEVGLKFSYNCGFPEVPDRYEEELRLLH